MTGSIRSRQVTMPSRNQIVFRPAADQPRPPSRQPDPVQDDQVGTSEPDRERPDVGLQNGTVGSVGLGDPPTICRALLNHGGHLRPHGSASGHRWGPTTGTYQFTAKPPVGAATLTVTSDPAATGVPFRPRSGLQAPRDGAQPACRWLQPGTVGGAGRRGPGRSARGAVAAADRSSGWLRSRSPTPSLRFSATHSGWRGLCRGCTVGWGR
jgi:hypothetical protein